ncbi:MAG: hypothetical protein H0W09_05450 [Solirubrobacterales bacterium]|nr:hypothetical protein [Solirubrobacterales bacterium]
MAGWIARLTSVGPRLILVGCMLGLPAMVGCGGEPDTERAEAAIGAAYDDFAAADAPSFCARLSDEYEDEFAELFGRCRRATLERLLAGLSESELAMVGDPDISGVKIEDQVAGSTVNREFVKVVEEDGDWKLADFALPDDQTPVSGADRGA